jgi:hypothetical protein
MAFNQVASTNTTNIVPVQAVFNSAGQCLGLVGPGGAYFSPPLTGDAINGATINSSSIGATTPSTGNFTTLSLGGNLLSSATAPTLGSGWGTSPTLVANNTTAFKVVVGTGGASSGTINFPTAPNGWIVYAADVTSGTLLFLQQTGSTTTSATVTSYGIQTGLASPMLAGDAILITAFAY